MNNLQLVSVLYFRGLFCNLDSLFLHQVRCVVTARLIINLKLTDMKKFTKSLITVLFILGITSSNYLLAQELEFPPDFPEKRIVYQIPEMKDVKCHSGIVYHSVNGIDLKADIYVPSRSGKSNPLPIVIIVINYPDSVFNKIFGRDGKDLQMCVSWAELIAASGMAAVAYQTQFSHLETDSLICFLKKNAEDYNIDMNNLCVFGASANTLAAQSLMQNDDYRIKCAVFNYGILLTPDQKYYTEVEAASSYGFYFSDLRQISKIPENIPMLVTRAGKDRFPIVQNTTDYFVAEAMRSNAQLTYINYSDGQHDFDVLDDTKTSRLIIKQTVDFMKTHLLNK